MRKIILAGAVLLTTAIGASSFAMADKTASASPEQMQQRHASMCSDRTARETGRLAYLEAKLKPTSAQTAAWTKYRDAVAAQAKVAEQNCLARPARTPGGERPSIVERQAMMQKGLEARLASLKATQPALQALYATLNDDQKQVLDRQGFEGRRHFANWRGHGPHGGGMEHKARFERHHDVKPAPEAPVEQ
jgi:hypothetical protein